MLELLPVLETSKKRNYIYILISIFGVVSSFIAIILLTLYYQGLMLIYFPDTMASIAQELTLLDFFWMILILLFFFFANTSIWYHISTKLSNKSIKNLNSVEKSDNNENICYNCGITASNEKSQRKISQGMKILRIFNVKGYFCKECYQKYSWYTLGTILQVPLIYFFLIFLLPPLLAVFGISFIPGSYWYLYATIIPVLILSVITLVFYLTYNKIKISKIYDKKTKMS